MGGVLALTNYPDEPSTTEQLAGKVLVEQPYVWCERTEG